MTYSATSALLGPKPTLNRLRCGLGGRWTRPAVLAAAALLAVWALADGVREHSDLTALDPAVTQSVVGWRTPLATVAAQVVTTVGSEVVLGTLTAVVVAWLFLRGARRAAAHVAGWMVVAAVSIIGLKHLFGRARPTADLVVGPVESSYSFPSGHTLSSTVFFGLLAVLACSYVRGVVPRRLTVASCLVAIVAIGASRVYLGYHWMTDVLGGWAAGAFIVAVSLVVMTRWPLTTDTRIRLYRGPSREEVERR